MVKKDVEKTVMEVATSTEPGLFVSRISTEKVKVRGTTFVLETIPKNVKRYAISKFRGISSMARTQDLITLIFRLGCTDIIGLKGTDGEDIKVKLETIKIDGADRKILPEKITEGLFDDLLTKLGTRVLTINSLSDEELDKLDFTKSSDGGGETV